MKITEIPYMKEVADVLNSAGLAKIEVQNGDARICLEKELKNTQIVSRELPVTTAYNAAALSVVPEADNDVQNEQSDSLSTVANEIKSPIVGVFYASRTPEAEPFVNLGETVKKGDVLCIIEAMKFFNEITADHDGKIVDICLKNGDLVEFGQVLFKIQ